MNIKMTFDYMLSEEDVEILNNLTKNYNKKFGKDYSPEEMFKSIMSIGYLVHARDGIRLFDKMYA